MKPLIGFLLFILPATAHPDAQWETKVIGHVSIDVPTDSQSDTENTPGTDGAVQRMEKYSFRNQALDLEVVFLFYLPGTSGNLDAGAENMSAQLKAALAEESIAGRTGAVPTRLAIP